MKRNGRACLDAFAWLAWLQDEPGAAAVQHWLDQAEAARAECVTSIINLGEAADGGGDGRSVRPRQRGQLSDRHGPSADDQAREGEIAQAIAQVGRLDQR